MMRRFKTTFHYVRLAMIGLVLGPFLIPLPVAAASEDLRTRSVSPGDTRSVTQVSGSCPTFSWAHLATARSYELLVYRISEEDTDIDTTPYLRHTLPEGATTWTPSAKRCLTPGDQYMWVVQGVVDGKTSSWSEARMFEVASVPSVDEVRQALIVLEQFQASQDTGVQASIEADRTLVRKPEPGVQTNPQGRATPIQGVSLSGTAAIRGNQTDGTGETLGVVGQVDSADGAGVAAANTSGGADLLLDGSSDSETDTVVSQGGIDRLSVDAESFEIKNSGGGGMTVLIDGVEAVTTATDSDTLGNLSCAQDQITQWNGSAWVCTTVQGGDTLGNLSCTDGQVVHFNGSAWVCGQPSLLFESCTGTGGCSMTCPAGSIVWTGGCETTSGNPASVSRSRPTSGGAGQPPTGWQCSTVNPLGASNAAGFLYCVTQ